jgi:hypothetical protein
VVRKARDMAYLDHVEVQMGRCVATLGGMFEVQLDGKRKIGVG